MWSGKQGQTAQQQSRAGGEVNPVTTKSVSSKPELFDRRECWPCTICPILAMLPAFRATCMRSAANSARFCTAKRVDVEELRLHVTRKYLPLADSTSNLDESARCSRASIAESLKTIEDRQEQRKKSGIFAIEGTRCKHGFPRAYMQLPVHELEHAVDPRPSMQHKKTVFQSGMIRLSCPHLTKAIDQFEYEGTGIKKLNEDLNEPAVDSTSETEKSAQCTHDSQPKLVHESYSPATKLLREHYREINAHYKEMKKELITEEQRRMLYAKFDANEAEEFLSSGIGGISERNENDVKCLHLHTADALLRGREANKFGAWTLEQLEKERGVDVNGCADCWQQCDPNFKRTDDSWWYNSVKNKARLHAGLEKRKEQKKLKRDRREASDARESLLKAGLLEDAKLH